MVGNVWEWCADWYDEDAYVRYRAAGRWLDAPVSVLGRVLRGGSWGYNDIDNFRCAYRDYGPSSRRYSNIGFRMAT